MVWQNNLVISDFYSSMRLIESKITPGQFKVVFVTWTILSLWLIAMHAFALKMIINEIKDPCVTMLFNKVAIFASLMTFVMLFQMLSIFTFYLGLVIRSERMQKILNWVLLCCLVLVVIAVPFFIIETKLEKFLPEWFLFLFLHSVVCLKHRRYLNYRLMKKS